MTKSDDKQNLPIHVKIVSPLFEVAEEWGSAIEIPATLGIRTILPKQAPLFCALREGRVVIHRNKQTPLIYLVSRGVCEVRDDHCSVLAWSGRFENFVPADISALLDQSENMAKTTVSDTVRRETFARIDFFKMVLKELENK